MGGEMRKACIIFLESFVLPLIAVYVVAVFIMNPHKISDLRMAGGFIIFTVVAYLLSLAVVVLKKEG